MDYPARYPLCRPGEASEASGGRGVQAPCVTPGEVSPRVAPLARPRVNYASRGKGVQEAVEKMGSLPLSPAGREAGNDTVLPSKAAKDAVPNSSSGGLIGYYLHISVILSRLHSSR